MVSNQKMRPYFCQWLLTFLLVALAGSSQAVPSITMTNIPTYGVGTNVGGVALGVSPTSAYAVALFIYVPGQGWWSKLTCPGQPLTPIQPDGSWGTSIVTTGSDKSATRIAALLVSTNYNQPCVLGSNNIPTNVYAQAVASTIVTRKSGSTKWLNFSGYDWWLRSGSGLGGPGPNYWSDSTSNIWLDAKGWLHVRITNRSGKWQCAELVTARTFGYGSYRFEVESPMDALDPNVTIGLFTWSNDPAYADREIDIEGGRWQQTNDVNNSQFVVQPSNNGGGYVRYRTKPGLASSTHCFTWETNRVSCQAQVGSYVPNPASSNIICTWNFTKAANVPQSGDENIHINFWLVNGLPPVNGQEAEFVIKSFEFVPLDPPVPASVANFNRGGDGNFQFTINTQPDRRYRAQVSTDLADWQTISTTLATNITVGFQDTNAPGAAPRFYRVVTLP